MSGTVIRVENLSKKYTLRKQQASYQTFSEIVAGQVRALFKGRPPDTTEQLWALKQIHLEISAGDRIGIVGRNGAGKSTLLKVLSRIIEPSEGVVSIKGRVASLLEVGTGFHPELTGRENIFLNGTILGMTRSEIKAKFDEIVEFAEVAKFLDTPVKRYSSGMYVKLAFAVAAHLDPEILIVDEVLAVGDAMFQKKCLGKMEEVSKNQGRTVLFVSHNMQAVSTLTSKCFFLQNGRLLMEGKTEDVIARYLAEGISKNLKYTAPFQGDKPTVTGVTVETSLPENKHVNNEPLKILIQVSTPRRIGNAAISFQVMNKYSIPVLHIWIFNSEIRFCNEAGTYMLRCEIPRSRLYMGSYSLKLHFSDLDTGKKFETLEGICPFEVVMYGIERDYEWVPDTCAYIEDFSWKIEKA